MLLCSRDQGNDHRVTMVTDGNFEDWFPIPAHSEAEIAHGLQGCYQDCSTDAEGNTVDRVCDDGGSTDVQTVEQCQARCAVGSYAYMGLACPRAGAFECWCCNDFDQNSAGTHAMIGTQECSGGELTSGVNGNQNAHCSGFANAAGGYELGGYYLGGHCRAAIYNLQDTLEMPSTDCNDIATDSYVQQCSDTMEWHASIDMSSYSSTEVCNVQVNTGGGTCADYCAEQGRVCMHAQDNAAGGCDLGDLSMHERQDTSQNGCLQTWGDQICGCGVASADTRLPPAPPTIGPPPELVSFDQYRMGVCYQLRAANLDVVMHEMGGDGSCSDGSPIYAQTSGHADSFKFVAPLSPPDGDQLGDVGDTHVVSI
eukprot:SAG11_NODE_3131_length_2664_cov_5.587914_1_plen_367_part_10